ncbi:hypothetical protein EYF80_051903 [Liparis tanakae]|uniref:Uncharacterized protein n=1 Tax=Liparis tanakae TaxID=230148 RepID=A0A4Z2F9V6_9TELE|nr:hypothetical protein EYF80_051903 [Liparis tanakae]
MKSGDLVASWCQEAEPGSLVAGCRRCSACVAVPWPVGVTCDLASSHGSGSVDCEPQFPDPAAESKEPSGPASAESSSTFEFVHVSLHVNPTGLVLTVLVLTVLVLTVLVLTVLVLTVLVLTVLEEEQQEEQQEQQEQQEEEVVQEEEQQEEEQQQEQQEQQEEEVVEEEEQQEVLDSEQSPSPPCETGSRPS